MDIISADFMLYRSGAASSGLKKNTYLGETVLFYVEGSFQPGEWGAASALRMSMDVTVT